MSYLAIDGFRFIENLQTTARQLSVCSEMVKQLNNKQLPKNLLEELLVKWSIAEESSNIYYRESKGKITNNGKKTAALRYYFALSESLGLIKGFNNVFMNTSISYTFLHFLLKEHNDHNQKMLFCEKIFYLFQLLTLDADALLLLMSLLSIENFQTQRALQNQFKEALNERLVSKLELASSNVRQQVKNKFQAINYVWKKPEVYAEHIIAPRYEWLSNLGLVNIMRDKKFTTYTLSRSGEKFYNGIPTIAEANKFKDINETWLSNNFFNLISNILTNGNYLYYREMSAESQKNALGRALENAVKSVKSSISSKLPLTNTYLFISMDLLVNSNIVINFSDIYEKLNPIFQFNLKSYMPKVTARLNESYISINDL